MPLGLLRCLIWLRALCILAVAGVGFSTSSYSLDRNTAGVESLEDHRLPDGSLPVICLGNGVDDGLGEPHDCGECCLSVISTIPPPESGLELIALSFVAGAIETAYVLYPDRAALAAHPARAPPFG